MSSTFSLTLPEPLFLSLRDCLCALHGPDAFTAVLDLSPATELQPAPLRLRGLQVWNAQEQVSAPRYDQLLLLGLHRPALDPPA